MGHCSLKKKIRFVRFFVLDVSKKEKNSIRLKNQYFTLVKKIIATCKMHFEHEHVLKL